MTPSPEARRGARELRRLLRGQDFDVRRLDRAGVRDWLARLLPRWQADPVFAHMMRVRDLRRANPQVGVTERVWRRAAAADAAGPHFARLQRIEQELTDASRAVAGLSAALKRAESAKRPALRHKLAAFRDRVRALREEQARLVEASPARQALRRAEAELQRLRAATGLDEAEAALAELQRQRGRRGGRSGESFEQLGLELTRRIILPEVARRTADTRVLSGVTLGAARTEFDHLVVRLCGDGPVDVLAAVEVKRNVNDLAHGFLRRQEDLAWLVGEAGRYDPAAYRTSHFRGGHFDRPATHREGGTSFAFDRGSFRHFRRDEDGGQFLARLYFVTRPGPLWGLSAAALARLATRVASDEGFDPDDDACLDRLLRLARSLAGPTEAPDVLRLYAASRFARQVLLIGNP